MNDQRTMPDTLGKLYALDLDRMTGQTAGQRRAAIDAAIDRRLIDLGRESFKSDQR